MQGVLLKTHGGFYFVQAGDVLYAASPRGRLRQELKNQPLGLIVGDDLTISLLNEDLYGMAAAFDGAPDALPKAVIEDLLPRRNFLIRPKIANVDQCLIVLAAKHPKPDLLLLDRLLVILQAAEIKPIILLNKMDQAGADALLQQLSAYQKAGFTVLPVSAAQKHGIEPLTEFLAGKITTVAGQSGVGKSTLLNLLQPHRELLTGDISQKLQRGRHTTRTVELLPLDEGGWIADTPGFSRLSLPGELAPADISKYYPDFAIYANACRYDGCRHRNEPVCGVKDAVAEGRLDEGRYQRYLTLLSEATQNNSY